MKNKMSVTLKTEIERLDSKRYLRLDSVLPEKQTLSIGSLRVLLLADTDHPANVIQDHIGSLSKYSDHDITIVNPRVTKCHEMLMHKEYDALILHSSLYFIYETYLSLEWQEYIICFPGVRAVIREDEYQRIEEFSDKLVQLGMDIVYSNINSPGGLLKRVYSEVSLGDAWVVSGLPGYICDSYYKFDPPQISERSLDIIYRGRTLQPQLGLHAQDKMIIGEQMLEAAQKYGLQVDISSEESERVYGAAWPKFLMTGKAMLGVEGGASIFDFDGSLRDSVNSYKKDHSKAGFKEIWANCLEEYEGNVLFKTITPKFFEAIAAKTALILYPGEYSGILFPDRHYIVLQKDGSNMPEVVGRLRDDKFLQELVDRVYSEILFQPKLHKKFYVEQLFKVIHLRKVKIEAE